MQNLLTLIFSFLLINTLSYGQNAINFNFRNLSFDSLHQELTVAVEIENDSNDAFILGDQNIRFYYSGSSMEFVSSSSKSTIPTEYYSQMEVVENIIGYNASLGTLSYDDNLGFVNYNVYLEDLPHGGISIESGEKLTVATLAFVIKEFNKKAEITAARPALTAEYATAYVAVTEWTEGSTFQSLDITTYGDTQFSQKKTYKKEDQIINNIKVGPNPTRDYITVSNAAKGAHVRISDMSGNIIYRASLYQNKSTRINLKGYQSGGYVVTVTDGPTMTSKKILITQ